MNRHKKIFFVFITIFIVSIIISPIDKAFANSFYSENDILFYNSADTGCVGTSSNASVTQNSKTNQEAAAKFFTTTNFAGNSDKPMNAIQMAAIMGNIQQDSGFNPKAGEGGSRTGIAQWISERWAIINDPKTDLTNQLNFIKTELDGTYKDKLSDFWSSTTVADLGKATYAIARNYDDATDTSKQNVSAIWTGNIDALNGIKDWQKRTNFAQTAYDNYGNMASSGYVPGPECGGLVSGGMTLEKAKTFMATYKNLTPNDWPIKTFGTDYNIYNAGCSGGPLANCVAFSQYFVNRYTTKTLPNPRDGHYIAGQLIALGFKNGGHIPKVYSVFSLENGGEGHTGVVLGIDTANKKIIIGEAGCGRSLDSVTAKEYSLDSFSTNSYTYAYTDGFLKGSL